MLDRLQATGQVFDLTPEAERSLRERGVSEAVISGMRNLNQQGREQVLQRLNQE